MESAVSRRWIRRGGATAATLAAILSVAGCGSSSIEKELAFQREGRVSCTGTDRRFHSAQAMLCKVDSRYRGTYQVCVVRGKDGRVVQLRAGRCR